MTTTIIAAVILLILITAAYKLIPFREAGNKKPLLAVFPKYKKRITHTLTKQQIEQRLSEYGFKKIKETESDIKFSRGSILGDISIKLTKVDVGLQIISQNELEVTVQAGGLAAVDTGDHWLFITELCEKFANPE